jgi:hypothetical protein
MIQDDTQYNEDHFVKKKTKKDFDHRCLWVEGIKELFLQQSAIPVLLNFIFENN